MGPPSRSLSPDAHDCIMVEILRSHRIQGCDGFARTEDSSPSRSLPAPAPSDPACTTVECEEGGQTEPLERFVALFAEASVSLEGTGTAELRGRAGASETQTG